MISVKIVVISHMNLISQPYSFGEKWFFEKKKDKYMQKNQTF